MKSFYYDHQQLQKLVLFNAIMLCLVIWAGNCCPEYLGWISVAAVLCLISFSASLYVVIFPQRLALINEEGIKIDHNALLKWEDIDSAEQRRVSGCLKRDIIFITPKEGVIYRPSLMQRISRRSPYGAFSIPLYAMTADDREAITKALEKYLPIKKQA